MQLLGSNTAELCTNPNLQKSKATERVGCQAFISVPQGHAVAGDKLNLLVKHETSAQQPLRTHQTHH